MNQGDINAEHGRVMLLVSVLLTVFGLSAESLKMSFQIAVWVGTLITGILASRYYILANKEKKQQIELNRQKLEEHKNSLNGTEKKKIVFKKS